MLNRLLHLFLVFVLPCSLWGQNLRESLHLNLENGLSQSTVTYIEEDILGRIWIATPNGLNFYNGFEIGKIEEVQEYCIGLYSLDSNIFCLGNKGIFKINIYNFKIERIEFKEADFYNYTIVEKGILVKSPKNQSYLLFDFDLNSSTDSSSIADVNFKPTDYTFQNSDVQLLSNPNGVFHIKNEDSIRIHNSYSAKIVDYNEDRFFVSTHNGLLEINIHNKVLTSRVHFEKYRIENIFKDSQGNLWIASSENGLFMLHRNLLISRFVELKDREGDRISSWTFEKIAQDIYVNSNDGLKNISHPSNQDSLQILTEGMSLISSYSYQKSLFLGTLNTGLYLNDSLGLRQIFYSNSNTLENTIIQIFPYKDGILASSKRSMMFFSLNGDLIWKRPFPFQESKTYSMNISTYKNGFICNSTKGVYILDSSLKVLKYPRGHRPIMSMSSGKEDAWIASLGEGLFQLKNDKLSKVEFQDYHLHSVFQRNSKELWIGSSTAVYKKRDKLVQRFGFENGFPIKEYNQGGFYFDSLFYYSGVGGVFVFHPDSVSLSSKQPKIILKYKNKILNINKPLELDFDQSEILLKMEKIHLLDKENFEYYFEFDGQEISPTKDGNLDLSLEYGLGEFSYHIKNRSLQTKNIYSLKINRKLPFWKELWFKIVFLLFMALGLLGLFSLWRFVKTKKMLNAQKEEHRLSQERLRISQDLHDNIGARISHIISSLDMEMFKWKGSEKPRGLENINAFARQTMTQLRETIWMVSDKSIFYSELLVRIQQYVLQIDGLSKEEIIFIQTEIEDFELGPIQTINFYRIVQESINNALKYSNADRIIITAGMDEAAKLRISVEDNGRGFDPENAKRGSGLMGMKERAEEVKAQLKIESSSSGTSVILSLE